MCTTTPKEISSQSEAEKYKVFEGILLSINIFIFLFQQSGSHHRVILVICCVNRDLRDKTKTAQR